MGKFRPFRAAVKFVFDIRPKEWLGWDRLKESTKYTHDLVTSAYQVKKSDKKRTFDEALEHFNLTEEDLKEKQRHARVNKFFFIGVVVLLFCYLIYLSFHKALVAMIITLSLMIYSLSQFFYYSYWDFQIRIRKLGPSVRDWYESEILGENVNFSSSKDKELKDDADLKE